MYVIRNGLLRVWIFRIAFKHSDSIFKEILNLRLLNTK